jgi:hypothetical protein
MLLYFFKVMQLIIFTSLQIMLLDKYDAEKNLY